MTTPMRSQYLAIKKQYPDIILLFRLGDFYETFDDDARIVSSVCDVVLTSRPVGADERVPLAGVPYHAIDGYIAKLINAGYKVAIAEQIGSEPPKGEKLVPRVVRRVVTPGTLVEPGLLPEKRNNYIAALVLDPPLAASPALAAKGEGGTGRAAWHTPTSAPASLPRPRSPMAAISCGASRRSWDASLRPRCCIRLRIRGGLGERLRTKDERRTTKDGGRTIAKHPCGTNDVTHHASHHLKRSLHGCSHTMSPPTSAGALRRPLRDRCSSIISVSPRWPDSAAKTNRWPCAPRAGCSSISRRPRRTVWPRSPACAPTAPRSS